MNETLNSHGKSLSDIVLQVTNIWPTYTIKTFNSEDHVDYIVFVKKIVLIKADLNQFCPKSSLI